MAKDRVYCCCCGRQIVSYRINEEHAIGPASDGCLFMGTRNGNLWACPPCGREERERERILGPGC